MQRERDWASVASLRDALADALDPVRPHVERITLASAVICTAFQRVGMAATLVGGGAIEFHAPGSYTTHDLDFVVEGGSRELVGRVFEELGFEKVHRHWALGDLFVEVPGNYLEGPVDELVMGQYILRVVKKEYVVAQRVVGFRYWKSWAQGLQAIDLINALGPELDHDGVRTALRKEQAEDAYALLRKLAAKSEPVDAAALDRIWHRHYR